MLNRVRKFIKNSSPDWLNTEVNKDLLQNLTANIRSTPKTNNIDSASLSKGGWRYLDRSLLQVKPSLNKSLPGKVKTSQKKSEDSDRPISNDLSCVTRPDETNGENCLLYPKQGTPHWRRIRQVFQALDNAPTNYTYNQLIEYVREATGVGCSRKLIGKWKKQRNSHFSSDISHQLGSTKDETEDNKLKEVTDIVRLPLAIADTDIITPDEIFPFSSIGNTLSTVNDLHLAQASNKPTRKKSLMRSDWSLMTVFAAAGIAVSLVGCEIMPFNSRPTKNVAIASVTTPITPLTPIPERKKNRLEPRNIKIELTLSNPQDLKVKPGDKISAGQVLSDRVNERNRLQAKKKQLQLSLEKLNLPLTPIAQPKPIPEIAELPPVSYAEEEAAIKYSEQKLTEAERAIALQQKKIDSLTQLRTSPSNRLSGGGDIKLILEHERANLANLEAARQSAQIQLEVQESKLTTAKERRAYIEYQRQLEQTRRAIALQQRNQAIASQESERERLLAEREYSQAQIETQIQTLDYQIEKLSSVRAPYEGTIKKVKWTGQSDHNLTAVVTLSVTSQQSAVSSDNSERKPISDTQAKQTTKTQP